jgi:hypothetical protein
VPSQRLLKILDPIGHASDRVLESRGPKGVVWTTARRRDWIARELWAAGVTPLFAASLRHVSASLHPSSRPYARLAVIDLDALGPAEVSVLATARWSGYRGTLIAVATTAVDARLRTMIGIDDVVAPESGALTAVVARRITTG